MDNVSGTPFKPLLEPSSVAGVYARSLGFEQVVDGLGTILTAAGAGDGAETLRFPPVLPYSVLQRNGYFVGFPHLAGCVHSFTGSSDDHKALVYRLHCGEDAGDAFAPTGCALTPAACYPLYPLVAARGALPEGGAVFDVESYCYRHEPSDDPARMQSFRMREYVCLGDAAAVAAFQSVWQQRARDIVVGLQLTGRIEPASDPFFGEAGVRLRADQADRQLKHEMLLPIAPDGPHVACMSFNRHDTHFTAIWGIRRPGGAAAHSGCVGFGLERLALALFAAHGASTQQWPAPVRDALWPRRAAS